VLAPRRSGFSRRRRSSPKSKGFEFNTPTLRLPCRLPVLQRPAIKFASAPSTAPSPDAPDPYWFRSSLMAFGAHIYLSRCGWLISTRASSDFVLPEPCLQGWSRQRSIPSKEEIESLSCTSASTSKTRENTLPNNSGLSETVGVAFRVPSHSPR
jgi:hypothetical protein